MRDTRIRVKIRSTCYGVARHAPSKIMRTAELRCLTKIISELLLDLKNIPAWVLLHATTGDKIDI
jgi:hypothetical protein